MRLKSFPLQPGGLLALEAVLIGLAKPATVYHEALNNFQVILLLIFMVAGIYFMKDLLLFVFPKAPLEVRSKTTLALLFAGMGAFFSAFWDALTVTAVIIAVGVNLWGFLAVYVLLQPVTETSFAQGILTHYAAALAEPHPARGIPASMVGSTFYKYISLGCVYRLSLPYACSLPDLHHTPLPAVYFRL